MDTRMDGDKLCVQTLVHGLQLYRSGSRSKNIGQHHVSRLLGILGIAATSNVVSHDPRKLGPRSVPGTTGPRVSEPKALSCIKTVNRTLIRCSQEGRHADDGTWTRIRRENGTKTKTLKPRTKINWRKHWSILFGIAAAAAAAPAAAAASATAAAVAAVAAVEGWRLLLLLLLLLLRQYD
eukprot:s295_g2.t1